MSKFSKKLAISTAWEIFKKNWVFLVGLTVISFIVGGLPSGAFGGMPERTNGLTVILGIIFWLLNLVVSVGIIKISLKFVDGKKAVFEDLYKDWRLVWKFLLTQIIVGIIVFLGIILLVIPGIIFGIKLQFATYYVVDKNLGPIEAVKKSWAATRGSVWNLFLLGILLALIDLVGVLLLGVGLLAAIPVTGLAMAWVYRKLS